MTERNELFTDLGSEFSPRPPTKKKEPAVDRAAIEAIAEENGFQSRSPKKEKRVEEPRPTPRRRRTTGRNQQINIKTTADAIALLYKLADDRGDPLGKVFEDALVMLATHEK